MDLLIADDNALSLRFFAEAAAALGHRCATAADGAAALTLARSQRYDLLLLDVRMPQLDGPEMLRRLRADHTAASQSSPALATTADSDAGMARELHAAGFAGVLLKPVDIDGLRRALAGTSMVAERAADYAEPALLDDIAACRSLGSSDAVTALRLLFAQELDALPEELDACLAAEGADLRDRLHKLCASAGFCGATRLEQSCRQLHRRLATSPSPDADAIAQLRAVAAATRQALG
ncbi:MAG: response regulator [Rhodanobacteraceae bacterium]|nr:response regulator [Rhodanobacteraceae bacterium]